MNFQGRHLRIYFKIIVGLIFLSVLSGCFTDVALTQGMQSGQIQLGSSKQQVAAVAGYPAPGCVKSRMKEDGNYEMWDYATRWCGSNLQQSYVLIFKNDKLIEIRTVNSRLDMQF
ncbi:MAG: hypothetical protein Q8P40_14235 [Nitrospirota bacterium]|nr:hypothetical protein [Nitrospirota bacterium]